VQKTREIGARTGGSAGGVEVALCRGMSIATVVDRVRAEFVEMPGLELTFPQARRLWNLDADDCRHVVDALAGAGFLKWTARQTIIRTGRDLAIGSDPRPTAEVSVPRARGGEGALNLDLT
jgi:hypothetical protein